MIAVALAAAIDAIGFAGVGRAAFPAQVESLMARAEQVRLSDPESRDTTLLLQGLNDSDSLVRGIAVLSMLKRKPSSESSSETPSLPSSEMQFMEFERARLNPEDRLAAARVAPLCNDLLSISDPLLRSRGVMSCFTPEAPKAAVLDQLSADAHWAVRARLATTVAAHPEIPGSRDLLARLSRDRHPTVQRAAAVVLTSP